MLETNRTKNESNNPDDIVAENHRALAEIILGNPAVYQSLFDNSEDVTLGNPFGPFARGWQNVADTLVGAASHYRDGEVTDIALVSKHITDTIAVYVETESARAKLDGGSDFVSFSLRVTSVFQLRKNGWKLIHRHADPIMSARGVEALT